MKKKINLWVAALFVVAAMGLTGCGPADEIHVSTQDLWYGLEAGTDTVKVTANCKWSIVRNDDADWYTITPTSGTKNDSLVIVTVEPLNDADLRASSFVIMSPKGHIRRTVFVSQNKLDFDGMINKIFGVMHLEHWNTDFFGEIIEDEYRDYYYNPYDTTTGYHLYFLEDGQGVQRDHHTDTIAYWPFTYSYDPVNQILHFDFETEDDNHEDYDCNVLTASDSLFRFIHEYKEDFWERADMRKVGYIDPQERRNIMGAVGKKAALPKRKEGSPIFIMD